MRNLTSFVSFVHLVTLSPRHCAVCVIFSFLFVIVIFFIKARILCGIVCICRCVKKATHILLDEDKAVVIKGSRRTRASFPSINNTKLRLRSQQRSAVMCGSFETSSFLSLLQFIASNLYIIYNDFYFQPRDSLITFMSRFENGQFNLDIIF